MKNAVSWNAFIYPSLLTMPSACAQIEDTKAYLMLKTVLLQQSGMLRNLAGV